MSRPPKVIPFSYSSLQSYETCPRRHYLLRIKKVVKEEAGEALTEGRNVHKAMEDAVAGTKPLPEKYKGYAPIVERLRAADGVKQLEYKFSLTSSLAPVDYWDDASWVRGSFDIAIVRPEEAIILDYKTGKRKFDIDQLRLFAMAALALYPKVKTVKTGYLWLQSGKTDREVFTQEHRVEIHREFAQRAHRLEQSLEKDNWPPRPSGLCREYCPVGFSLCEHCGRR